MLLKAGQVIDFVTTLIGFVEEKDQSIRTILAILTVGRIIDLGVVGTNVILTHEYSMSRWVSKCESWYRDPGYDRLAGAMCYSRSWSSRTTHSDVYEYASTSFGYGVSESDLGIH